MPGISTRIGLTHAHRVLPLVERPASLRLDGSSQALLELRQVRSETSRTHSQVLVPRSLPHSAHPRLPRQAPLGNRRLWASGPARSERPLSASPRNPDQPQGRSGNRRSRPLHLASHQHSVRSRVGSEPPRLVKRRSQLSRPVVPRSANLHNREVDRHLGNHRSQGPRPRLVNRHSWVAPRRLGSRPN